MAVLSGRKTTNVFAPLRGWYAEMLDKWRELMVFAPLRGWYYMSRLIWDAVGVFAPLRGWYTKYITEYRKMEELNA